MGVTEFFLGAHMIDCIVALIAIEALFLVGWRSLFRSGPSPPALISNLMAGVFLLLALRNSLAGASARWVAVCLLGSLFAHLADLCFRWDDTKRKAPTALLGARIKDALSPHAGARTVRSAAQSPSDEPSHG